MARLGRRQPFAPIILHGPPPQPPSFDEDAWGTQPQQQQAQILLSSRLVWADNDDAAPLGGFRLDDEHWHEKQSITLVANAQPLVDNDEQSFIWVDDEWWVRPWQQQLPVSTLVIADNDDAAPLGGFRLDDESWNPPQSAVLANRQPLVLDDDLPIQVVTVVDEDEWLAQPRVVLPAALQLWFDDDDAAPLGGFRLEEDYWTTNTCALVSNRQPIIDNDEQSFIRVDDEFWIRPWQQTLPSSILVVADDDESQPLGGFRLDDDYWIQPTLQQAINKQPLFIDDSDLAVVVEVGSFGGCVRFIILQPPPPRYIFYEADEFVAGVTVVDEDSWSPQPVRPLAQPIQPATNDDDNAPLGGFRLEEDYWSTTVCPLVSNRQPLLDQDELSFIYVDDEWWVSPPRLTLPSSILVWADTDESAPLGGFRLDEDYWQKPVYIPFVANRQPLIDQDEIGPATAIEEDQWVAKQFIALFRNRQPLTDNDEAWPLGGFRLDEDCWISNKQFTNRNHVQPLADADEFFTTLEEDTWLGTQRVLWFTNRQQTFEADEQAFIYVDDDSWVEGGAQAIWRSPVVFTDTDEWVPQPQPFGLDDEYWQVPGTAVWRIRYQPLPLLAIGDEGDKVDFVPPVPPGGSLEGCHVFSAVATEGCGIVSGGAKEGCQILSAPAAEGCGVTSGGAKEGCQIQEGPAKEVI